MGLKSIKKCSSLSMNFKSFFTSMFDLRGCKEAPVLVVTINPNYGFGGCSRSARNFFDSIIGNIVDMPLQHLGEDMDEDIKRVDPRIA